MKNEGVLVMQTVWVLQISLEDLKQEIRASGLTYEEVYIIVPVSEGPLGVKASVSFLLDLIRYLKGDVQYLMAEDGEIRTSIEILNWLESDIVTVQRPNYPDYGDGFPDGF